MKLGLVLACLALAGPAAALDATADATAKFLAGLPVRGTPVERFALQPGWAEHAAAFDRAWGKLELRQLAKLRAWAPPFLGSLHTDPGPMFYFFSGPDFLYAQAFFPQASTYILCGIEPVGAVPDLDRIPPRALDSSLANLRKSLDSVLSWSFFITKNMKTDLTQTQLSGTLPVLYVFLARAGCTIDSVESVALDQAGSFTDAKGATPGVRIKFFGPGGRAQTLYYFSSDLSDSGIKAKGGFIKFCAAQGPGVSLLKAASYLLHEEWFSEARKFLLTHSKVILQDDSGIPHRFFANAKWSVRYCGRYVGPIEIFKKYAQPDLAAKFASSVPAPLDFGFGYQWHPGISSLMIATPR
ncbi:MAG: hypothetical protein QOE70_1897 [Chthoniobacter sp.]|nr:hypothetical protein [Chthoniobacter sp.]